MFAEITVCFEQIDSVVEEQPDALTRLEAKEQTYSIFSIETGSTKQNKTKQNKRKAHGTQFEKRSDMGKQKIDKK